MKEKILSFDLEQTVCEKVPEVKAIVPKIIKPACLISLGILCEFCAGMITLAFMGFSGDAAKTGAVGLAMAF